MNQRHSRSTFLPGALMAMTIAMSVTGCSGGSAPASTTAVGSRGAGCGQGAATLPVDGQAAQKQAPLTTILIVNRASASELPGLRQAITATIDDASAAGDTVIVAGPGLAATGATALRGSGNNPSERQKTRCATTTSLITATINAAQGRPATTPAAIFAPLKSVSDTLASQGTEHADRVVVLGSAGNATDVPLSGEALDAPSKVAQALSSAGLLRTCTQTRFAFFVPEADQADHDGVSYREFWRQFARACGGRLVAWSPTVTPVGTTEIPPAATYAATPTAATATASSNARSITYTLQATTLFAINSAQLTPAAASALTSLLAAAHDAKDVTVYGYTDNLPVPGDPDSSQRLSQARADSVAGLLRQAVAPGVVVRAVGRGDADPVAPNTPTSRHLNRRVQVVFTR